MTTTADAPAPFRVRLDVYEGPFDLLLGLIAKHQLDVTELALSAVTDEFLAYTRELGETWDLGQATEFLVVAATLLDLKAARLLPAAEVEDEEDLALLEARDLLFARLLQYRAYKQAAALLAALWDVEAHHHPRVVALDERFAAVAPPVQLGVDAAAFARLAARVLAPRAPSVVDVTHVHAPPVSVPEQVALLRERLREVGATSFRALTADSTSTLVVIARFLGLLELFREGVVAFEQVTALGELRVRWTGAPAGAPGAQDEPGPADEGNGPGKDQA